MRCYGKRTNERKSLNEQWLAPAISILNIKYEFGHWFLVLLLRAWCGRLLSPFNCSFFATLPSPSTPAGFVMWQPKNEKKVVSTLRNEEVKSKSIPSLFFFLAQDPRVNAPHSNCWLRRMLRHHCYTLTWLDSQRCVHVSCVCVSGLNEQANK